MNKIWMIPALLAALSLFAGQAAAESYDGDDKQILIAKSDKSEQKMKQQHEKREKKDKKKKKDKRDKDKDKGRDKDKDKNRDKDRDQDRAKDKDRDGEKIYGNQLMTEQERIEHRERMRAAKTKEEREQIRRDHHRLMKERGRARGITLPDEPPADGGGMGPGGMGPRDGMGPGRGRGRQ